MSDRLRVIRDQIGKGDDVLVLNHGPKPRTARVVEVLRSAVRVRYADAPAPLHTVLLKDIQRVEEAPPDPRASRTRVKPLSVDAVIDTALATADRLGERLVIEPTLDEGELAKRYDAAFKAAKPIIEGKQSDLDAWLDMGREVATRIDAELVELEAQAGALVEDMQCMRAAFDEIERRKIELRARKTKIETVLKP